MKRIIDNPDYVRTNEGYIINTNSYEYSLALQRRKKQQETESRLISLEYMIKQLQEQLEYATKEK
jgi:hypothetical protein